jgi:hypothetical protein
LASGKWKRIKIGQIWNEQIRGVLVLLVKSIPVTAVHKRLELERRLAQTRRLANVSLDSVTQQRLTGLIIELSEQIGRIANRKGRITRDQVRARAFDLWEQHGCPVGRDKEFWLRAERDLIEDAENDS